MVPTASGKNLKILKGRKTFYGTPIPIFFSPKFLPCQSTNVYKHEFQFFFAGKKLTPQDRIKCFTQNHKHDIIWTYNRSLLQGVATGISQRSTDLKRNRA